MSDNLTITLHGPERGHPCYYCGVPTEEFFTCGLEKGGRVYAHPDCAAKGFSTCRTEKVEKNSMKVKSRPFETEATRWQKLGDHPAVKRYIPLDGFSADAVCGYCGAPMRVHGRLGDTNNHPVCPGSWVLRDRWGWWATYRDDVFRQVFAEVGDSSEVPPKECFICREGNSDTWSEVGNRIVCFHESCRESPQNSGIQLPELIARYTSVK